MNFNDWPNLENPGICTRGLKKTKQGLSTDVLWDYVSIRDRANYTALVLTTQL